MNQLALLKSVGRLSAWAGALALAVGLGLSGAARAGSDVYWSVGVASPGLTVGVSNAWPRVVVQAPVPVYVQAAPIYIPPYIPPRVVYIPSAPVYVQPAPIYIQPGWAPAGRAHGWHRKHGHHDRADRDNHHDRSDWDGRGGYSNRGNEFRPNAHTPSGAPTTYVRPGYGQWAR
jgi:hypothetical protein